MEALLAHSAQNGCPAQPYEAHARGVYKKATKYAAEAERYAAISPGALTAVVTMIGARHKDVR